MKFSPKAALLYVWRRRPRKHRSFAEKFGRDVAHFGSREPHEPWPTTGLYDRRVRLRILAGLCGGIILMLAVLCIGRIPKVESISAEDGRLYTGSLLIAQSGIVEGGELAGFDTRSVTRRLRERLPLLDTVRVRKSLGGHVTIEVTEHERLIYTCHNRNYYILDADTGAVLCVMASPDEARRVGAIYIGYPEAARIRVGEELSYVHLPYASESASPEATTYEVETGTPEEEYAYVEAFTRALSESALSARVVGMELSDRYDLWFVLDGHIRVRVGTMDELERKLTLAARSLEAMEAEGKDSSMPTLVDVSDPARIIHRSAPDIELPAWAERPV